VTYALPASVAANITLRAVALRPGPCGGGTGHGRVCGRLPAVLHPCGWRCAGHLPAPVNPSPDPTRTATALRAVQQEAAVFEHLPESSTSGTMRGYVVDMRKPPALQASEGLLTRLHSAKEG